MGEGNNWNYLDAVQQLDNLARNPVLNEIDALLTLTGFSSVADAASLQ